MDDDARHPADPRRDLEGVHVLVTRPVEQAAGLAAAFTDRGAIPTLLPAVEIHGPRDEGPARAAAADPGAFDIAIFVSRNAVRRFLALDRGFAVAGAGIEFYAVGEGTARSLDDAGVERVARPSTGFGADALLGLPDLCASRVDGRRVLVVKGEGGRAVLVDSLRERGAEVVAVDAYRRAAPGDEVRRRMARLEHRLNAITATSGEALTNLLSLADDAPWLRRLPWAVASERVARIGIERGLERIEIAREVTDGALVDAVARAVGRA